MGEHAQKEGVVPAGGLDFLADREWSRMGADDVEGESAQDGEVFGGVVLSAAAGVLVQHDVEDPMHLVLDTPMTAHDLQQLFGGDAFGQQIVAGGWLVGGRSPATPSRCDAADRRDAGEIGGDCQSGVAYDGRSAPLAAIVGGR